jgi:hypothetical protein
VFIFTPQSLYCQGKCPWYALNKRLGGPQSWPGGFGEEKKNPAIIWHLMELVPDMGGCLCVVVKMCLSVVQIDVYVRGTGYFKVNYLDFSVKKQDPILNNVNESYWICSECLMYYWNVGNLTLCV